MNKVKIGTAKVAGEILTVYIIKATATDGLRVILYDAEGKIYAVASMSIIDQSILEDEFIVHHIIGHMVKDDLLKCGLFEDTGKVADIAPALSVWRLKK